MIRDGDAVTQRPPQRSCIYCGTIRYRDKDDRKLGEEHVIAEGLGGTLILQNAACEDCERRINAYEQSILKTVLSAPRVHLGIRRKRRKRGEEMRSACGDVRDHIVLHKNDHGRSYRPSEHCSGRGV
jgi:HNH endonuclease